MDSRSISITDQIASLQVFLKTTQLIQMRLTVSIGIFTKIYLKQITKNSVPQSILWFFGDLNGFFDYICQNKENRQRIILHSDKGSVEFKSDITVNNNNKSTRSFTIQLERDAQQQLNQIRLQIKDDDDVRKSVENLWRRQQANQKIFLKFREDVEYKIDQINERMNIQNTKINIMQQDMSRISLYLQKLTKTVCPLLTKININSPYLQEFFLQDKKITYAGNSSSWTQILINISLHQSEKFVLNFKILNCKKGNIIVGVTKKTTQFTRSSLKKQKTMIGYAANGNLYRRSGQQKGGDGLPAMQSLKMIIDIQNNSIYWKNGNKTVCESQIGDLRGQQISPYLEFYDTGDAIQIL